MQQSLEVRPRAVLLPRPLAQVPSQARRVVVAGRRPAHHEPPVDTSSGM
jgi:hypothetical protein